MKLHQYSGKKPCYYCGAPGPSKREHAPPQMMFTGFDCDCITVPSCDEHNTNKSIGDRAIITAILMGASQTLNNRNKFPHPIIQLTPNVITAIRLIEPSFGQAKNEVHLRSFLLDPSDDINIPVPFTQLGEIIPQWVKQLTAALLWSVKGQYEPNIKWDESRVWSPEVVSVSKPITTEYAASLLSKHQSLEQYFTGLSWHLGWSAYPRNYPSDIYSFEVCFIEDPENWKGLNLGFRHRFYNGISVWYIWLSAPQETIDPLAFAVKDGERLGKSAG